MLLAPIEEKMWQTSPSPNKTKMSDGDINDKYISGEQRILTEINREKLPSFVEALKKPGYMNLRPFYQRRARWDTEKQSRLIESFLINIPVPPIILYEKDYNSYEVMDGQQRISAIRDFYENKLILKGLEIWPELEGRTYGNLPAKIRAGIDRRSISSIVIITESTSNIEEAMLLKQKTFERLNTGGVQLTQQEVRNCLYHGNFNSLLFELARHPIFVESWGFPQEINPDQTVKHKPYNKMEDVELVLRFFALRNVEQFRNGLKGFLDLYMIKSMDFSEDDVKCLREIFFQTINLAYQIYETHLFRPFDAQLNTWKKQPYKAYYDSVMVGFSRHLHQSEVLLSRKLIIIEESKNLFKNDQSILLTGDAKTKADMIKKIKIFDDMLSQVIGE